jgi:hypothetical protein
MRWYQILAVLVLVSCSLGVAIPARQVRAANGATINTFVTALNNGDLATAASQLAPSFVLTFADGTTANGADGLSQLVTPITVLSITPAGGRQVNAVLQFGSDTPVNVSFTGVNGMIATMTILGAAS